MRELRGTIVQVTRPSQELTYLCSGKPHPRWAEPNFCDGDATEKWHSRSTKRSQFHRQKREYGEENGQHLEGSMMNGPVVKVEPSAEGSQRRLYRLSPSPPAMSYSNQHQHPQQHHVQGDCSPADDGSLCSTYPSPTSTSYHGRQAGPSSISMPNNDLYYHQPYIRSDSAQVQPSCTCLTNPAAGHPLIGLTHQLQNTMQLLRQLPEHSNRHHQCVILRRITELNELLQWVPPVQ